ncbi:hypothetical protein JCM11641_001257 [Rhodosporidiobolus odoratus]
MTSPSSPLSRPPPCLPSAPTPVPQAPSSTSAYANTTSLQDLTDLTTLSYISSSLRTTFPFWLGRLGLITSLAYFTKRSLPTLLRLVAWSVSKLWTAIGWTLKAAVWVVFWAGFVATAGWLAVGVIACVAYMVIRARPRWRTVKAKDPVRVIWGLRIAGCVIAWRCSKWLGRISVAFVLGAEARSYLERQQRQRPPASTPTSSSPFAASACTRASSVQTSPSSAPPSEEASREGQEPEAGDDLDLERWARRAREEMLRESLLRSAGSGRQRNAGAAKAGGASEVGQVGQEDAETVDQA